MATRKPSAAEQFLNAVIEETYKSDVEEEIGRAANALLALTAPQAIKLIGVYLQTFADRLEDEMVIGLTAVDEPGRADREAR